MNNRILDGLVLIAQKEAAQETQDSPYEYESLVYKKFAELIIKKVMIEVVDEVQYQHDWATAEVVVQRVNDTFGVEP